MDYEPDYSGRSIRLFDVLVTLVLGGVVFAQIEIWKSLHPEKPAAPVAAQGPLAALPAQAVAVPTRVAAASARVYVGKPKVVKKARVARRSHASAMVITSRPRLAAHRTQKANSVPSTKGRAVHLPGGKARYEKPRDEFVTEVNPAEVVGDSEG